MSGAGPGAARAPRSVDVVAGIQARMGSTRLPGKMLADVAGEPLIVRVVQRLRAARHVQRIVVLTSDEARDDPLADELAARGIECRRGSEQDVLSRYLDLARSCGCRYLVRVTGDAPLVEPSFVDLQVEALRAFDGDFVHIAGGESGAFEGTLGGQGVLSTRALWRVAASDDPRDREHVGSFWFARHPEASRHVELGVSEEYRWPGLRLCVDEVPDLELVRCVFEHFAGRSFHTREAISWLRDQAEVAGLNRAVQESADNQACRRLDRAARADRLVTVGTFRP